MTDQETELCHDVTVTCHHVISCPCLLSMTFSAISPNMAFAFELYWFEVAVCRRENDYPREIITIADIEHSDTSIHMQARIV